MPPSELHHLVNTSVASHSSWLSPGAPLKPTSEMVPTWIWFAVTPRPVALFVSPEGALPQTGLVIDPNTSLEVADELVVLLPSTVALSLLGRLQATLTRASTTSAETATLRVRPGRW